MLNKLLAMERGLVFLSAPTNGGKTTTIKEIAKRKEKTIVISGEQLTDAILQKLQERPGSGAEPGNQKGWLRQ
jgi:Tfp pilus assembly pilus retraction ATPase PilT